MSCYNMTRSCYVTPRLVKPYYDMYYASQLKSVDIYERMDENNVSNSITVFINAS